MKGFLIAASLTLSACATSQPVPGTADATETAFVKSEVPIGKELTMRRPTAYYAEPDSTQKPVWEYPMVVQRLYIISRNGRWYRYRTEKSTRSYYVLVSSLFPIDWTGSAVPTSQSAPSHNYQTGPRGGVYYINKNGNKTYKKH